MGRQQPVFRGSDVSSLFNTLAGLLTPGGPTASTYRVPGSLYGNVRFFRDAIKTALILLPWLPQFAEQVLVFFASHIARQADVKSEALGHGHFPHEIQSKWLGNRLIDAASQDRLDQFASMWGGTSTLTRYYGENDGIPLPIILILEYVKLYGDSLLHITIRHADAPSDDHLLVPGWDIYTIGDVLDWNVQILLDKLDQSPQHTGFFGVESTNIHGNLWKVLLDGTLSFADRHTSLPPLEINRESGKSLPFYPLSLQGLSYGACVRIQDYYRDINPDLAALADTMAKQLRRSILRYFFTFDFIDFPQGAFASSAYWSGSAVVRMDLLSADAYYLLTPWANIFDDLPTATRLDYVSRLLEVVFSSRSWTEAGPRVGVLGYSPHWGELHDYQGADTVWPIMTYLVQLGAHYHGLPQTAWNIGQASYGQFMRNPQALEFWILNRKGGVYTDYRNQPAKKSVRVVAPNLPHPSHAFAVGPHLGHYLQKIDPKDLTPHEFQLGLDASWQQCVRTADHCRGQSAYIDTLAGGQQISQLFGQRTLRYA
jgi:hypothetical protein